jgi:hypothetical protein
MTNTSSRSRDPYDNLLTFVVLASGLLLAAAIWAWPKIPVGGPRYLFFFGVFVAFYATGAVLGALSRARDGRVRRRRGT